MPTILICAGDAVVEELASSPVWREGLVREVTATADQAATLATTVRPVMVVLDSAMPRAEWLVQKLRSNAATQKISIVVVGRGELGSDELGLLTAGANSVLRLPPTTEWNAPIERLLKVPIRKETRVPVAIAFEADLGTHKTKGQVLNVSLTGMLLECPAPLDFGSELAFDFHLHGFETSSGDVRGTARVVRLAGANRYGAEFLSFVDYGGELLRRFLLAP